MCKQCACQVLPGINCEELVKSDMAVHTARVSGIFSPWGSRSTPILLSVLCTVDREASLNVYEYDPSPGEKQSETNVLTTHSTLIALVKYPNMRNNTELQRGSIYRFPKMVYYWIEKRIELFPLSCTRYKYIMFWEPALVPVTIGL
jgi:hypothetical protein